jgi:prolyl-tRNA editing enzyme YbaK/EbsC (Cys-tRNA(Pro) deacylase)
MSLLDASVKQALDAAGIEHKEFACDPALADTVAFCEAYGFTPNQSANTIIVAGKGNPVSYCACVIRADTRLDVNKAVCKQMGVKRASFASSEQTQSLTGMQIGGVTVFGLPADLRIYVDAAVLDNEEVVMGGGNRSSKVILNPAELKKQPNLMIVEKLAKDPSVT